MQASRVRVFQTAKAQGTVSAGCVPGALGRAGSARVKVAQGEVWIIRPVGCGERLRNMSLSHQEVINYTQCMGWVRQRTVITFRKFSRNMIKYNRKC